MTRSKIIFPNRPAFVKDGVELFDAKNLKDAGEECPICRHAELEETEENIKNRVVMINHCHHVFHCHCLNEALNFTTRESPGLCPYCRQKLYDPSPLNVSREERIKLLKIEIKELGDRQELFYVNLWKASRRSQSGPDCQYWKDLEVFYRDLHLEAEKVLLEKSTDLEILLWTS